MTTYGDTVTAAGHTQHKHIVSILLSQVIENFYKCDGGILQSMLLTFNSALHASQMALQDGKRDLALGDWTQPMLRCIEQREDMMRVTLAPFLQQDRYGDV